MPDLTPWTKQGMRGDLWLIEVRSFAATVHPGLLHLMVGPEQAEKLNLPKLGITETLLKPPANFATAEAREQGRAYKAEQELIRRALAHVIAALPAGEVANMRLTNEPGAVLDLPTIYRTFRRTQCIRNPQQAAVLYQEIDQLMYRHGDDVEVLIGQMRLLDSALDAAGDGSLGKNDTGKVISLNGLLVNWPNRNKWLREVHEMAEPTFRNQALEAIRIAQDFPVGDASTLAAVRTPHTPSTAANKTGGSEVEQLRAEIAKLKAERNNKTGDKGRGREKKVNKDGSRGCKEHPLSTTHSYDECTANPTSANYGKTWKELNQKDT